MALGLCRRLGQPPAAGTIVSGLADPSHDYALEQDTIEDLRWLRSSILAIGREDDAEDFSEIA